MITALDSAVMDANSEALGVGVARLMGNAGAAVAEVLKERFHGKRVLFVCGVGNNGGDGIVAASLTPPDTTEVALLRPAAEIRSLYAREALSKLRCPVSALEGSIPTGFDVLVDCALGTGASGNLREPYRSYISLTRAFRGAIVSVDVPSGLGTDISVEPDITITFHDFKQGMNESNSGEILIKDIGIPKDAYQRVGPGDMLRYPIPRNDSHKGDNGRLLVIGGGACHGAPAMAAMAALRVGADIVRVAVPEGSSLQVASFSPVFVVKELGGEVLSLRHVDYLLKLAVDHDAVVIGPGLGTAPETVETVKVFISQCDVPTVVDADGLNALGKGFRTDGDVILTPHTGEFARLGGDVEDKHASASELARRTGATILLKGPEDIIADGPLVRVNGTGTPAMTGAGTGDVLSGIVGGLLSKGLGTFDAASLGAYISGKAGELAFSKLSYGMIATDVIARIPKVLRDGLRE
ncbi:MAG: NAD(P)H-hydrate dehydratase [Candidatus Methanoplasma sp.]|jgi:NAD(P)H-hydrate epimerase|nr:NAD(P)H-hydrate dehydratase [Candidatus Methanoplasma sp.]